MHRPDDFEQLLEGLRLCGIVNEDKGVDPFELAVGVFIVFDRLVLDDVLELFLHFFGFFVTIWVCKQVWMVLWKGIHDLDRNKIGLRAHILCPVVVDLVLFHFFGFVVLWVKVVVYQPIDDLCLANETRPKDTYSGNLHWLL